MKAFGFLFLASFTLLLFTSTPEQHPNTHLLIKQLPGLYASEPTILFVASLIPRFVATLFFDLLTVTNKASSLFRYFAAFGRALRDGWFQCDLECGCRRC